jgi:hypothetical protein
MGNIAADLIKGKELNDKNYKVHLDGYNQLDMLTKGSESARNEVWYFTESTLAAARIGDYKYVLCSSISLEGGSARRYTWIGRGSTTCVSIRSRR